MKRLASILCSGLLLVAAVSAFGANPSNVAQPDVVKNPTAQPVPGGWTDSGGETVASATVIPSLPYTDSDNTAGHIDDLDPSCGFSTTGPDLFYRYTPTAAENLRVSLCGSSYDTILFILDNGVEIACNDDFCALQSQIDLPVLAGHVYTFGIDGYAGQSGPYTLNVSALPTPPPCNPVYACPPGSQIEGEPICGPNYVDNFNGGCNSTPYVFQDLTCGYICGEMGTFTSGLGDTRDTDWYRVTLGAGNFFYNGYSDYPFQRLVITPDPNFCYDLIIGASTINCEALLFQGPGTFYLWAGPANFTGVPCGSRYWVNLDGPGVPPCGATAVEPATWGAIKNVYR